MEIIDFRFEDLIVRGNWLKLMKGDKSILALVNRKSVGRTFARYSSIAIRYIHSNQLLSRPRRERTIYYLSDQ